MKPSRQWKINRNAIVNVLQDHAAEYAVRTTINDIVRIASEKNRRSAIALLVKEYPELRESAETLGYITRES